MDIIKSLQNAIKNRDYDKTVVFVPKVCEEILRYKKVVEIVTKESIIKELTIIPKKAINTTISGENFSINIAALLFNRIIGK